MIKALSAYTYEIDEPEVAVAELLAQLDLPNKLCQNSVGIVSCYAEFLETGVIAALSAALPFEIVGCTTLGNACGDANGLMMLTLLVLTGDDVFFSTAVSESLFDKQEAPIRAAYQQALAKLGQTPQLIIPFAPLIDHVGGELVLETLNAVSDGVPIFGPIACDHNSDYHQSHTILQDNGYRNAMTMLLIAGNIQPEFHVLSIPEAKVQKQKAIITASEGNILKEVNYKPLLSHMRDLGLVTGTEIEGANAIPFVVDCNDGTQPLARAIYMTTEQGYAVCGGQMPVGATLAVGSIDYEDVLETAEKIVNLAAPEAEEDGVLLLFPCLSRNLVLSAVPLAELDLLRDLLQDRITYQVAYAGGEMCPISTEAGLVNRIHNYSVIACRF